MFKTRSIEKEWMDDSLNHDDLKKNLDELAIYNRWLGGRKVLIHSLNLIRKQYSSDFHHHQLTLGDLGCGGGDLLRATERWVTENNLNLKLLGIDGNPAVIQYAKKTSKNYPQIDFETMNLFTTSFTQFKFDIVCINSVCHHFSDDELIQLLKQLKKQTRLAIIINDLQRHWFSYYAIKYITKFFNVSDLAKHDAPLSVLRAFTKKELVDLLTSADCTHYQIHWAFAFRWSVLIWI